MTDRMAGLCTYLIDLVIILRVVLEDLWFLFVIESPYEIVRTEGLAPFLAV